MQKNMIRHPLTVILTFLISTGYSQNFILGFKNENQEAQVQLEKEFDSQLSAENLDAYEKIKVERMGAELTEWMENGSGLTGDPKTL